MSLEIFNLKDKTAIITGGSRGLGKAMALALAGAGANTVLISRNREDVEQAAAEVASSSGRKSLGIAADVCKGEDVEKAVEQTLKEWGQIDILVNNAGVGGRKSLLDLSEEEWDRIIDINLKGTFLCAKAVGKEMVKQRKGKVINVSSTLGSVALAGRSAYASSKGGVIQFTKALAVEWAPYNIHVNAICPGPFETEMNKASRDDPEIYKFFAGKVPLGRWGKPEEIAGTVIYLASEASSFVTGATIYIDGGWTAI